MEAYLRLPRRPPWVQLQDRRSNKARLQASMSMDATLTMLFSDEATEKIKRCIFRTIQLSTRTTKPYSFIGSRFPSLCFSSYVRNMRYNDDTLPRVKTICLTTNGASKTISDLDVSKAPSEVADFLECYNSLVASIGLNEHLHATFSIPHFRCGLKSTNTSTRITGRQVIQRPIRS